ncbi:hypothetical protein EJ04DRAFT_571184 [Polyplosphaeria fusca]|uniref:BTB domain-containing protein n=1 Tax=Polyplosphaeria fusca TaxID=682080 RepID=A0A9P4QKE4_9PLEO|nr:hypothetical protein EJ04DRAFT_571184 [Polyplosphaeria fusca]
MSPQTVTVKLRDKDATPVTTKEFSIPVARVIQTSAYFRARLSSPSKHRDGIIRIDFPNFSVFEIYIEWLHTGNILTISALLDLRDPYRSKTRRAPEDMARLGYIDYLGAWFLGDWIKDTTFKDSVIDFIISKMNNGDGYPQQFVRALKPSIVNIVYMSEQPGNPIRKLLYAAISTFAEQDDVRMFVPGDTEAEEYPRIFVRELLVWQHRMQAGLRQQEEVRRKAEMASMRPLFSGFTEPNPKLGIPTSHVSWPSTDSETDTATSYATTTQSTYSGYPSTISSATSPAKRGLRLENEFAPSVARVPEKERANVILRWPRNREEYCFFHEHWYEGQLCRKHA